MKTWSGFSIEGTPKKGGFRTARRESAGDPLLSWSRLSEQFVRVDKWSVCRG
jgi:hypothetical protein